MIPFVEARDTYRLMDVGQKVRIEELGKTKAVLFGEDAPHGR
jgi:hypothetical protein